VRRAQPERSIDDARWAAFGDALAARVSPEARVIELMVATGMRIGDALRVRREPVLEALSNTEGLIDLTVKGGKHAVRAVDGAPAEWAAIGALFRSAKDASNVAELVTPGQPEATGGPAYMRVRTELRAVGKIAGVEGRVHLHRVRRTVAVKALQHTKDIVLVSKLLDHGSITTTMKYVDEGRADEVAQLQRELAAKRGKK
jgi:integrase